MIKTIYKLFNDNKFKKIYKIYKKNPKLLEENIIYNQNIFHLIIKINNKKLLYKLLKLNDNIIIKLDAYNNYLPNYALDSDLYDIFFYLIDYIYKKLNNNDLFNTMNNYSNFTLTHQVIFSNNEDLLFHYLDLYYKNINWLLLYNNASYIYFIVYYYYNHLDKIFILINKLQKINIDISLLLNNSKYNSLLFLIYVYFKPASIIYIDNKLLSDFDNKNLSINNIKNFISIDPKQLNIYNDQGLTPVHYIVYNNNLELLKFCIKNNCNLNNEIKNLCHYIMNFSNETIIKYILEDNEHKINFNIINSYNETPIFSLLRNNNNININLIFKLLKLTDDWNIQNIFGNTILHYITIKDNIEDYFDIFKIKYFDINIKNIYLESPLSIYIMNLKKKNYETDKINKKISELKNIIINNYYIKLKEINYDIKCNNIEKCQNKLFNMLSKESLTNLDKLSIDYNSIIINDYLFTEYNLSGVFLKNIYLYNKYILSKYNNIGIPFDINNFDFNKITNFNNENLIKISLYDKDTIKYAIKENQVINKYKNLYTLTINWIDYNNYIIPHNIIESTIYTIESGKNFIFINILLPQHLNILLIDVINKRFIRFEPAGGINLNITELLDNKIKLVFYSNNFFKDYIYYEPKDFLSIFGFQSLSTETDLYYTKHGDFKGYCISWCFLFIEIYLNNLNNNLLKLSNLKKFFNKIIKKLINNNVIISEYIRNYANFLHSKILEDLTNNNISINYIYNNDLPEYKYNILCNFINSTIFNLD